MSTEQVDYDTLYDKGFTDGNTEVTPIETDIEEEEVLEQPSEEEVVETETQTDEEEEETTTEEEEDSNEPDEEAFLVTKYKGQDIKLSKEEAAMMASKGFDYTSKTQDLAKNRDAIKLMEEYGIDMDTLQAVADASKGNEKALATIANKFGIDPYNADEVGDYKPQVKQTNHALNDVVEAIQADKENSPLIDSWLSALPDSTTSMFNEDPKMLSDIYQETISGNAQKIMPEVIKQMAVNPMASFKDSYLQVRANVVQSEEKVVKPTPTREEKKKATINKKQPSKHIAEHEDVWTNEELYQKMQNMRKQY